MTAVTPRAADRLVAEAVAGGWPTEWVETRTLCWTGPNGTDIATYSLHFSDHSCGDLFTACWRRFDGGPWRFSGANDGDGLMSLRVLRTFVCNGPCEVPA